MRSGGLFERVGGVTFSPGPAALDGAVLGASAPGVPGDGEFAIVRFRALADGDPAIRFGRVLGRDERNQAVAIDLGGSQPPAVASVATRFLPAAPSPFRSETALRFTLAAESKVELVVFGIDGRRVRTLARGSRPAGYNQVTWDGRDDHGRAVASGVYFARMTASGVTFSQPLMRVGR